MLFAVLFSVGALFLGGTSGQFLTQCPDSGGWVPWQTFCYLFINSTRISWEQAGNECQSRQGQLLRIETADEYNFVRKAVRTMSSDMYWTALNNLVLNQGSATTPSWMWGSDGYPLDSIVKNNWDQEPDNTDQKDCVKMNTLAALSMADCNDHNAYICEMPVNTATGQTCPPGWSFSSASYCYKISNASDSSQRVTWSDARKVCEALQNNRARLLAVTSREVQAYLADVLPTNYRGPVQFWTGLNDRDNEGTFYWAGRDNAPYQISQFTGYWNKEPNNLGGNEHCGTLLPTGKWSDRTCTDQHNYACRIVLSTAPQELNYGCGTGWMRAGSKCVHAEPTMKTWQQARQLCQTAGGDLLTFDSRTDADWATLLIENTKMNVGRGGMWIGLNDQQTEGTFAWADGTKVDPAFLYWDHEPNNNFGCAVMTGAGAFFTFDCNTVHAGTICEDATSSCRSGWKLLAAHCYLFDTSPRTRTEASAFCKSSSPTASLFALNTQNEKAQILQNYPATVSGVPDRYWSGLINSLDSWMWENPADQDPQATSQLVKWSREPNNLNNEDCVEVLANGRLNDASCSATRGFVCQKRKPL